MRTVGERAATVGGPLPDAVRAPLGTHWPHAPSSLSTSSSTHTIYGLRPGTRYGLPGRYLAQSLGPWQWVSKRHRLLDGSQHLP